MKIQRKAVVGAAVTDYNVNVWAQVTGANGTATDDGFYYLFGSLQSLQISGGVINGAAGVGVTTTFTPYDTTNYTVTSPTGSPGVLGSVTADSIQDLGTGTSTSTTTEIKLSSNLGATAGTAPVLSSSAGATTNALPGSGNAGTGTEFLLGHITFHVGGLNGAAGAGAATALNWVSFQSTGIAKTSQQQVDAAKVSTLNAQSTIASGAGTPNNGIVFTTGVTPPPSDTIALGTASAGGTGGSELITDGQLPSSPVPPAGVAFGTPGTGVTTGNLHIVDLANTGNVYVLMHVTNGNAASFTNLTGGTPVDLTNATFLNSNLDWKALANLYTWANVGFKFSNAAGGTANDFLNFNFSAENLLVDQAIAVPEPASLGPVAAGVMTLMMRRRRAAR